MASFESIDLIGAKSADQACCAARAVFECRIIVSQHLKETDYALDDKLHALEMELYRIADALRAKAEAPDGE